MRPQTYLRPHDDLLPYLILLLSFVCAEENSRRKASVVHNIQDSEDPYGEHGTADASSLRLGDY